MSMARVNADVRLCQGYANCVAAADDYFDIDDDGRVVLLHSDVPETDYGRVAQAAHSCPVSVLSVER
jgi:3-phenylpropionate/trans-cinnamate dioxygenase ferredoxin reductase subunit